MRINFKTRRIIPLLCAFFIFAFCGISAAEDIQFEVTVDTTEVALGSSVRLNLTVIGTQDISPVDLPDIEGFEARYVGPSTRVSIVNGQYSSSKSFIYSLLPLKAGTFTIPAIDITIKGKTYTSRSITVKVVSSPSALPPTQGPQVAEPLGLSDRIFITMETPKSTVYRNEKIPLTIKLFVHQLSVREIQLPEFAHTGFTLDDFEKPKQYQQVKDGLRYDVVEFETFVYPTRSGPLTLGPAQLACQLLIQSSQKRRSSFDRFGGFFDEDFFGGFFNNYQRYPLTLKSEELKFNVLDLPRQGHPKEFSGAVGKFDFDVTASPREINFGDPVTLRMKLKGEGNLKNVEIPQLNDKANFKIYEPQITTENGTKILEQVVIPKSEDVTEIPAIAFHYFDVDNGEYKTILRGPFALTVTKSRDDQGLKVVAPQQRQERYLPQEEFGRDIIFIKDQLGKLRPRHSYLYQNPVFLAVILITALLWAGLLFNYKRTHKLKTDSAYAQKFYAPKKARQSLQQAQKLLSSNQQPEFYDALHKTLQDYLSGKFHLIKGVIAANEIEGLLAAQGLKPEIIQDIKTVFAECEMVRYASASLDQDKMRASFDRAQRIIDFCERH